MFRGFEHKSWRLTLTEVFVATEDDDETATTRGDEQDNSVLMIEGPAATVAAALTLVGQLTGVDGNVSVQVAPAFPQPDGATLAREVADQDAPAGDGDKPRRTRRTKAQIEADKLAAEQGTPAPAEAQTVPAGPEPMRPFVPIAQPTGLPTGATSAGVAPGYSPFG